ncbi:MAG: large-conductance mechanosensitive channel protein MscL [Chloroflexota bacterium]
MLKEFKDFILRGNVLDMAVGIIIGAAFSTIVKSMVDDIIMPPIGLLVGGVNFSNLYILIKEGSPAGPYASLANAQNAGAVTINYGIFLNAVIAFLIVALALFLMIRAVNRMMSMVTKEEEAPPETPTAKECPYCRSTIALKATRCAFCTSELP